MISRDIHPVLEEDLPHCPTFFADLVQIYNHCLAGGLLLFSTKQRKLQSVI